MKKKISTLGILAMMVLTLGGCGTKDKTSDDYDYNQERLAYGGVALTPNGLYTIDSSDYITCISPKGERLNLGTEVGQEAGDNNEKYPTDIHELFYYNDKLLYSVIDLEHHRTYFYSMSDNLDVRKAEFEVVFPNFLEEEGLSAGTSVSSNSRISGNIYVEEFSMMKGKTTIEKIYVTNLDEPTKTVEVNLDAVGGGSVFRAGTEWILITQWEAGVKETMLGYNVKTKEIKIFANRTNFLAGEYWLSDAKVRGDEVYWYEYGTGFCKKNIKENTNPNKKTVVLPLKEGEWMGNGTISRNYFILCNMKYPKNPILEEKEGISFYNLKGELKQFIATKGEFYRYFMETKDKIYFSNEGMLGNKPTVFIEKASLKKGSAKLIKIENTKGN